MSKTIKIGLKERAEWAKNLLKSKSGVVNGEATLKLSADWKGVSMQVANSIAEVIDALLAEIGGEVDKQPVPTVCAMVPVQSSNIARIGYMGSERILRVEFKGGQLYEYLDVPTDAYERLWDAPSVGSHFQRNIKGSYEYRKVS